MATLPAMANGVPEKAEKDTTGATMLKELIVDGSGAVRNRMAAETGHTTLSQEQILDMPVMFAEPDIVKTLQTLPGVSMGSEGFTSLLVRGGENDQNLFLYHGIPLYHVSHLGGVFSSFNVATVGKVDFYKGSFPAMYGGRTSSVVDITMQEPDFEKVTSGNGWSYGADFSLTKEAGSVTGTISYGLMWAWRKFEEINGGKKFPGKYDNRHKININVSYRLNKKIEFNAGWTYMTGNRMTLSIYNYDYPSEFPGSPWSNGMDNEEYYGVGGINYIPATNNIRIPDYHRLDLGMQLNHFYRNGNKGVWNFSLYNAYCRMNPITVQKDSYISYYYAPGDDQRKKHWVRRFRALSFIPILPSFSYTYIF